MQHAEGQQKACAAMDQHEDTPTPPTCTGGALSHLCGKRQKSDSLAYGGQRGVAVRWRGGLRMHVIDVNMLS